MKRYVFLFFSFLALVNCAFDDSADFSGIFDISGPCFPYTILFSEEDCDCEGLGNACASLAFISADEYERILEIQENSEDDCIYIQGVDNGNNSFEGYVIDLNQNDCP
jgi:hypothetical protein